MLQTVIMECQVAFSRVCGTSLRGQGVINTMCYEEVRASYKDELSHEENVIPVREGVVRKYNIIVIDECSIFVSCLHLIGIYSLLVAITRTLLQFDVVPISVKKQLLCDIDTFSIRT